MTSSHQNIYLLFKSKPPCRQCSPLYLRSTSTEIIQGHTWVSPIALCRSCESEGHQHISATKPLLNYMVNHSSSTRRSRIVVFTPWSLCFHILGVGQVQDIQEWHQLYAILGWRPSGHPCRSLRLSLWQWYPQAPLWCWRHLTSRIYSDSGEASAKGGGSTSPWWPHIPFAGGHQSLIGQPEHEDFLNAVVVRRWSCVSWKENSVVPQDTSSLLTSKINQLPLRSTIGASLITVVQFSSCSVCIGMVTWSRFLQVQRREFLAVSWIIKVKTLSWLFLDMRKWLRCVLSIFKCLQN